MCRRPPGLQRRTPIVRWALGSLGLAAAVVLAVNALASPFEARAPKSLSACPERTASGRLGVTALGFESGHLPRGATPFDEHLPGVGSLDPQLLAALQAAARDAAVSGVRIEVNSGWRSHDHQARLLCQAVLEYGSWDEAARWVASPDTSLHVSGLAVDVGPPGAADWLASHGAEYGMCRVYSNEPWHFELRDTRERDGCPQIFRDPSHDPRLQTR